MQPFPLIASPECQSFTRNLPLDHWETGTALESQAPGPPRHSMVPSSNLNVIAVSCNGWGLAGANIIS